jgi:hypothetical protein
MLKSVKSITKRMHDSLPQPFKEAAENIRYFGLPVPIRTVRPYSMLRACIQLRRIVTAANCTPARKFLASLS